MKWIFRLARFQHNKSRFCGAKKGWQERKIKFKTRKLGDKMDLNYWQQNADRICFPFIVAIWVRFYDIFHSRKAIKVSRALEFLSFHGKRKKGKSGRRIYRRGKIIVFAIFPIVRLRNGVVKISTSRWSFEAYSMLGEVLGCDKDLRGEMIRESWRREPRSVVFEFHSTAVSKDSVNVVAKLSLQSLKCLICENAVVAGEEGWVNLVITSWKTLKILPSEVEIKRWTEEIYF